MRLKGRVMQPTGRETVTIDFLQPHGLCQNDRVVLYPAASDPVAEEREALKAEVQAIAALQRGDPCHVLFYMSGERWRCCYDPPGRGPLGIAKPEVTQLAAARALRASLEEKEPPDLPDAHETAEALIEALRKGEARLRALREEAEREKPLPPKPVPDTIEECAEEADLLIEVSDKYETPGTAVRWSVGGWEIQDTNQTPIADGDTCLEAWQAAVRKLRQEASSDD